MQISDEMIRVAHAEYHKVLGDKNRSDPMRAALTAALSLSGWRTIDSAPKDGSTILVYFKQHGWMTVRWTDGDGDSSSPYAHWHVDDHKHGPYPVRGYSEGDDTHWQPLDAPPATAGKEE